MVIIYLENGPLNGQTREIEAGKSEFYHYPECGGTFERRPDGSVCLEQLPEHQPVVYYRIGRLHDGLPVFAASKP